MARRLTSIERREYGTQVVRHSSRGVSDVRIAEQLGLNRRTVKRLREEFASEIDPGAEVARAQSLQAHRDLIALCWQRINASGRELAGGGFVATMHPNGLAGLVNSIQASQKEIDKLMGVAPAERIEHEFPTLTDFARQHANTPRERRLRLVDES